MNARTDRYQALSSNARTVPTTLDFDAVETRSLFLALWQGRWKIGGLAFGVGVLVWIAMLQVTPTYTVYSKLMLDTRKAQIVGRDEVVADVTPSQQIVNGEIGVLQSNLVIAKMLTTLTPEQRDQLDPALKPQSLVSRAKAVVKWLVSNAPTPESAAEAEATHQAQLADAVRSIRTAYAQPDSYIMVLRVDSTDPVLARDVANGLTDAYISLQLDARRSAVVRATSWLEQQLGDLRAKVESTESAVAQFQADSLIADGGTLDNVTQQLGALNAELATTRTARLAAETRLGQMKDILASGDIDAAAAIIDTPTMKDLAAQQLKLRQDDAVWARTYNAKQTRRVEIQTKLDEVRTAMQGELERAIAAGGSDLTLARNREAGTEASIRALEGKVMNMTNNQLGLRQLNREADAARQTYESFLARIAETRAQQDLQQPDSVVVERAMLPDAPSAPRPTLLATLAMTVTAALAAAWVLLREMAPTTFRSTRELVSATGLPVLTALPDQSWTDTRDMLADLLDNPHSVYAERIRHLRTAINLRRPTSGRGQSVMILGSVPGEGKTTTALALTRMAAASGRSAIIVDCDLRRPSVLRSLGGKYDQAHDFGDYIDCKCDLPEAICSPPGYDFDVLAARAPLRGGGDELSVTWLGQVLRELERAYDYVIVDAPAILAVSDALIVAQEVRTNFFLVSCDDTRRDLVQRSLTTLSEMGIEIRGLILNKVDPQRFSNPLEGGYGYEYLDTETWKALPAGRV
ncbi:MAG: polysaccharide biosynthesis tyrosine autokinase [bacterium]